MIGSPASRPGGGARRLLRSVLLSLHILAAACSGDSTVTIDASDDGGAVSVEVGTTLEVTLAGNPTTGYIWEVDQVDTAVLAPVGDPEFTPDRDADGAGGVEVLTFDAVAPGETILDLVNHRPFEDEPPLETFSVTVTVTDTNA